MTTTAVDIVVKVNGGQKLDRLDKQLKGANASVKGLAQGLAGAAAKIAAFTGVAVGLGAAFDTLKRQDFAIAKVKSLGVNSQVLTTELKKVTQELKGQASQVELTAAAYDVASAGFTNAADAAKVLKAASLGATGGFSDINTVGNATTSVLNAYGLSADKAAGLVDKFIQTQNDGKIVVEEYARNIGKVAAAAAGLGIPLEEVNAAIAQSTASGVQAEVAFTGLKTALARLASGEAAKELEKYGITISAASLEADGLVGTLKKLVDAGLDTGAIFKVLGTEAAPALLPLINNLERTEQLVENQRNSAGAAAKAQELAANTITGAIKRIQTAFENLITSGDGIGKIILPALQGIGAAVEALNGPIGVVVGVLGGLALAWYAVAKAAGIAAAAQAAATAPSVAAGIGALATKLAVLGGGATTTAVGWTAAGAAITKTTVAVKASTVAMGALNAVIAAAPWIALAAAVVAAGVAVYNFNQEQQRFNRLVESGSRQELAEEIKKVRDALEQATTKAKGYSSEMRGVGQQSGFAAVEVQKLKEKLEALQGRYKVVIEIEELFSGRESLTGIQSSGYGRAASGLTYTVAGITYDARTGKPLTPKPKPFSGPAPSGGGGGGGGGGAKPQDDTKSAQERLRALEQEQKLTKATSELQRQLLQITFDYENTLREIEGFQGISDQLRQDLRLQAEVTRSTKEQKALLDGILDPVFQQTAALQDALRPIEQQRELLQAKLDGNEKEVRLNQQIADLKRQFPLLDEAGLRAKLEENQVLEERVKKMEEMKDLMNSIVQKVGTAIEDSIVAAIDSAVDGTKELGQALQEIASSLLKDVGRMLLRTGINSLMPTFAAGGRPEVGRPSIVGENGPEIFIPDSAGRVDGSEAFNAARQAMTTSSAVQSSAEARAEEAQLFESAVNSMNPIDIRYDATTINNVSYVSEEQLIKSNKMAVKEAQAKVFAAMRNKPATRAQLGIG